MTHRLLLSKNGGREGGARARPHSWSKTLWILSNGQDARCPRGRVLVKYAP